MRRLTVFLILLGSLIVITWPGGLSEPSIGAAPLRQDAPPSALVLVYGIQTRTMHPDCATIRPDGTHFQILATNVDPYAPGAGVKPLCNANYVAVLSPDGNRWLQVFRYPYEGDTDPDRVYDFRLEVWDIETEESITLATELPYLAGHQSWVWQFSWLPDSQGVLVWDEDYTTEDRGPDFDGYLGTGRARLLGVKPFMDTTLATFTEGEVMPVIAITPDGLPALAISPDGASVLFRVAEAEGVHLYGIPTDGSGPQTLVEASNVGSCVAWSPDGERIVLESRGPNTVQVIAADGTGRVTLAEGHSPAWSPDGSRIVFNCPRDDGTRGLCLVNPDGSALQVLPIDYVGNAYSPYWSPDGGQIAFIGRPTVPPDSDSPFNWYDLNLHDLANGQTTTLFGHEGPYVRGCGGNGSPILWSPDEQWILYEVITPDMLGGGIVGGPSMWYVCQEAGCQSVEALAEVGPLRVVRWLPAR